MNAKKKKKQIRREKICCKNHTGSVTHLTGQQLFDHKVVPEKPLVTLNIKNKM